MAACLGQQRDEALDDLLAGFGAGDGAELTRHPTVTMRAMGSPALR
jgi:hypothetical protein